MERERATLQVVLHQPPLEWSWVLRDARGTLPAHARLDLGTRGAQLLLEREALEPRMTGVELREELTAHLRELLTEPLADALASCPARTLQVIGPRSIQLALSLPFELLFGRDDPGAVVIRTLVHAQPPSDAASADATARADRIAAAFALTDDGAYLPLHHEAALLEHHARAAGVALDELFVTFAGEDLLRVAQGASIVHLAGHGIAGAMRCEWRDPATRTLTSAQLVDACRAAPPRLVVLGFCESSSEREELGTARFLAQGVMTLDQYAALSAATPPSSTASMAVDLAATLPTAVIALRTSADDTQARRFVDAFYAAHLREGCTVEEAYARALAERGFHDAVGLPVPVLYVGSADGRLASDDLARPSGGPVRCLTVSARRVLNTAYKATSPLGAAFDGAWLLRVAGAEEDARDALLDALAEACELWRTVVGVAGPSTALAVHSVGRQGWEVLSRPIVAPGTRVAAARVDLDRWTAGVSLGELIAARGDVPVADLRLVADAACDVPALVDAVLASDIPALAVALRAATPAEDRAGWPATRALLELLPEESVASVRARADARWSAVEQLGQGAIDLLAALSILPEGEDVYGSEQPLFAALSLRTGTPPQEEAAAMRALMGAGIVTAGTGRWREEWLDSIWCELLTGRRAWHARSPEAAGALAAGQVDMETRFLPSLSYLESVATERLVALAELCLAGDHGLLPNVLDELQGREDGRAAATALRERAGIAEAPRADPEHDELSWAAWDQLVAEARFDDAGRLLDRIEASGRRTDHPLRITASRLVTRVADPDQQRLAQDAWALEQRLVAEAPAGERSEAQQALLLLARQTRASALRLLGRRAEAAEPLLEHFAESVRTGARASACAYAGAHAILMLCLAGDPERARPVCDALLEMVADLRPSLATILVRTAEVQLLFSEGRLVHASAAAEELVRHLAAWPEPRIDELGMAASACACAFIGDPRSVVFVALLALSGRHPQMTSTRVPAQMAGVYGQLPVEAVDAAAAELAAELERTLARVGITADALRERSRGIAQALGEVSSAAPEVAVLGEAAADAIERRAADGCLLSQRILEVARRGLGRPAAPPTGPRPFDPHGIARRHPRLRELVGHLLLAPVAEALPVLFDAWHGDREAALAWAALVIDDAEVGPSAESHALAALARHDLQGTWNALHGVDDLRGTVSLCVTIEECCLSEPASDAARASAAAALTPLASEIWRRFLEQAAAFPPSARALGLALASSLGTPGALLRALSAARAQRRSLAQFAGAGAQRPLAAQVLDTIERRVDVQLVLAEAAIEREPEHRAEALELVGALDGGLDPELLARAARARVRGLLRDESEDGLADALDELLARIEPLAADARERAESLNAAAVAACRIDRHDLALQAVDALEAHPILRATPLLRLANYSQRLHCLVHLGEAEKAATTLRRIGVEFGFSAACGLLVQLAPAFVEPLASPLSAVMAELARADDQGASAPAARAARAALVERIGDAAIWCDVRRATETTLRAA